MMLKEWLLLLQVLFRKLKGSDLSTLKERFDKAFYRLLEAGKSLEELSQKVDYAGKLVKLNKIKQEQIKETISGL